MQTITEATFHVYAQGDVDIFNSICETWKSDIFSHTHTHIPKPLKSQPKGKDFSGRVKWQLLALLQPALPQVRAAWEQAD